MTIKNQIYQSTSIALFIGTLLFAACSAGPLTTREKSAGIGAGALIGDQLQSQEYRHYER